MSTTLTAGQVKNIGLILSALNELDHKLDVEDCGDAAVVGEIEIITDNGKTVLGTALNEIGPGCWLFTPA